MGEKGKVYLGAMYIGTAKVTFSGEPPPPLPPMPKGEITISGTFEMDRDERRNMLVFWLMFSALAEASRILD